MPFSFRLDQPRLPGDSLNLPMARIIALDTTIFTPYDIGDIVRDIRLGGVAKHLMWGMLD